MYKLFKIRPPKPTPNEKVVNKTSTLLAKGIIGIKRQFVHAGSRLDVRLSNSTKKLLFVCGCLLFVGYHGTRLYLHWGSADLAPEPDHITTPSDITLPDSLDPAFRQHDRRAKHLMDSTTNKNDIQ